MSDDAGGAPVHRVARRAAGPEESARASRVWWERAADEYQAEHGAFLRDAGFVWGPEGLDEADAQLLGPVEELRGARVLEVGCGAAQCSRWLRSQGAERVVGIDVSGRQLQHARRIDEHTGVRVPTAQADVQRLPFAAAAFDLVCSAYGGLPFVPADAALAEAARVLRPGGRLVFSVSHPVRWCFPDDPGPRGLTVQESYFDRRTHVEEDAAGRAVYVEHHHTLGDWVRAITGAGLVLRDLVEPEWPEDNEEVWGGWSPLRGRLLPGTAVFAAVKPGGAGAAAG
ncbi:class I SAM-dependent methyltransferase [Streptomonospora sp. PA3]|uniref:class I SAM-dependent methyltransferase n=1 Tax=Streptomonospora sp. PA3 TaxID=2607326 RepID=UPI0012DF185C|nr:class I SAM-dependent methyltransferase [Streptomonospora sp. PA3]MUL42461.1 class I SAM-dependent methyltransferase [Streptomonospora sp. PA3]